LSFLNPLFLFGLLAASIPILIHLFTRRRPREVAFPSLEFLQEVNQSEIRRLKLKQWILLLLRTLAIAAIALAMSRPALRGSAGLTGRAATTIVALVDRSGSMTAEAPAGSDEAGATLVARARGVLEDLLATLGPADELLLVPYDRDAVPSTPEPTGDLARLRGAVQTLEAGAASTDHRLALDVAAASLARSNALNRELFWISDFQASGFAAAGDSLARFVAPEAPWEQWRVYLVPVEPRSRVNVGLSEGVLAPTEGGVALSVTALARDASPGDLAVEAREIGTGFELGRGFLDVPQEGEAATLLPLARIPAEGGLAEIPDDVLALDNRRFFAAGRGGTQRVLLREDGGASALRFALEAGSPASGLAIERVDAAGLPGRLADADVVVLNDLERLGSSELQAVLDYHRAGGALFVVLGERADADFWNASVLGQLGAGRAGAVVQSAPGAAWRLTRATAGHAVLAGFPARPGEPLSNARFERIRPFALAPGARALLRFDPSHPALIEAPHALLFAASLGPEASDFPVSGAYLPLLHQAVKVLARGTAAPSLEPGERYAAPATTGAWRIEDHDGREIRSETAASGGATRLLSAPLERPGLYRVLRNGALRSTFAVNPSPLEFDLGALDEQALVRAFPPGRARIMRPGGDLATRVREARFGRELWSWFVVLALLLLTVETVIARWGMPARTPPAAGEPA
jgi:hypothetical protein